MISEKRDVQHDNQVVETAEAIGMSTTNKHTYIKRKKARSKDNENGEGKTATKACHCSTLLLLQVLLGILCAFKPAEAFVVPYYVDNGISMDQINQVVFPTSGYSNFGFLLVLSVASIGVSHTALLYLGWTGYVICYILLIFVDKLIIAIFDEIFYGLAVASETVYCASFYFLRNRSVSEATSHLRASTISRTTLLITHVVSDLFGQLMVSLIPGFSKRILFIITAVSVTSSLIPLTIITCIQRRKSTKKSNEEILEDDISLCLEGGENGDVYESTTVTEKMSRKLYLRGLSYVWGGGIAAVLPLYIGIFSLSGHTLYQNYITNILYDVQQGTNDEFYGLFVMSGRLSGVVGSVLALVCKKAKHVEVLQLTLLLILSCLLIVPAFITQLSWLFIANITEFATAELTITIMWAQLAASCQLSIYPAVFLCQALVVAAIVLIVQATVFNNVANEFGGFTANQTHYIWCALLGFAGVIVSLVVTLVSRFKRKCNKSNKSASMKEHVNDDSNTDTDRNEAITLHLDQSCEV